LCLAHQKFPSQFAGANKSHSDLIYICDFFHRPVELCGLYELIAHRETM
jgi:hypothetical protein